MDYLACREYSVFELEQKLIYLRFEQELVDQVIEQLRLENLIDDQRFCESVTRSRVNRGQGPVRISRDLRQKGVNDDIVSSVVKSDDRVWYGRLEQVHEKKYGITRPQSTQEWAKRARFLESRGFTRDQIRTVLDSCPESGSGD